MALYSNLHDYRFNDTDVDDIRGAAVYGIDDEKLGKVEDVIFDNSNGELRYVVVDSGGWLSSKKFLVPARHLTIREEQDKDFHANLTKAQIEKLPEYKADDVESDDRFTDYEKRYKSSWADSPILHREGSTHILTPENVAGAITGAAEHIRSPKRIAHDMPRFGATSTSDSTDAVSLAGETDVQPMAPGSRGERRTVGGEVSEVPETNASSGDVAANVGELREDQIGTGYLDREYNNARLRAFEERLRRDREEIARRRGERAA